MTDTLEIAGLGCGDAALRRVDDAMVEARRRSVRRYPWPGLEKAVRRRGLTLVGYGSLINAESAAMTLSEAALATAAPCIAFGGRRVFDSRMERISDRYDGPAGPDERAALNVRVTSEMGDLFNGVVLTIGPSDVPALREREEGYDLAPVACIPWQRGSAAFPAWVLSNARSDRSIQPHPRYLEVCREGAAAFGEAFLMLFEATTYRSDGVTLVGA